MVQVSDLGAFQSMKYSALRFWKFLVMNVTAFREISGKSTTLRGTTKFLTVSVPLVPDHGMFCVFGNSKSCLSSEKFLVVSSS